MDERLDQIVSDLQDVAAQARQQFGDLTALQLNWRPAPDSWGVGQCFDHLIRTNRAFFGEFDRIAGGVRRNTFWQSWSPFTGFCGRFLARAYETDERKIKVPSKDIVPPTEIGADIIEQFRRHTDELIEKVLSTAAADRNKTILTSPFVRVMTYTLDDYFTVLIGHNRKHFRQAQRVTNAADFPQSRKGAVV